MDGQSSLYPNVHIMFILELSLDMPIYRILRSSIMILSKVHPDLFLCYCNSLELKLELIAFIND